MQHSENSLKNHPFHLVRPHVTGQEPITSICSNSVNIAKYCPDLFLLSSLGSGSASAYSTSGYVKFIFRETLLKLDTGCSYTPAARPYVGSIQFNSFYVM
jgi:hypothetical protein